MQQHTLWLLIGSLLSVGIAWKTEHAKAVFGPSLVLCLGVVAELTGQNNIAPLAATVALGAVWVLGSSIVALCLACLAAGFAIPAWISTPDLNSFGLAFGGGLAFSLFQKPSEVTLLPAAMVGVFGSALAFFSTGERGLPPGVVPALLYVGPVAALAFGLIAKFGKLRSWPISLGLVVSTVLATSLAIRNLPSGMELGSCLAIGVAAAAVVYFAVLGDPDSLLRQLIAIGLWVAAGAFAFSLARTGGMAIALAAGGLTAALLGSASAVNSAGILASLISVRALEEQTTAARLTLDFSHHHALLGLVGAAAMVLLVSQSTTRFTRYAPMLSWLIGAAAVFLIPVLTGPRAVPGCLIGVGLGMSFSCLLQEKRDWAWLSGSAMYAAIFVGWPWLSPALDMNRDQKMPWLISGVVVIAILSGILALLNRPTSKEEVSAA